MHSYLVGLEEYILVWVSIYVHIYFVQKVKTLARLHRSTGSSDPLLLYKPPDKNV